VGEANASLISFKLFKVTFSGPFFLSQSSEMNNLINEAGSITESVENKPTRKNPIFLSLSPIYIEKEAKGSHMMSIIKLDKEPKL